MRAGNAPRWFGTTSLTLKQWKDEFLTKSVHPNEQRHLADVAKWRDSLARALWVLGRRMVCEGLREGKQGRE